VPSRRSGSRESALQLVGDAEVFLALGNPAADLAEELSPLHQVFVGLGKLLDVADILQIAEVIFVIRMGHLVFFHFYSLSCPTLSVFFMTDNVVETVDYNAEIV
jgi:hypothetical protein